MTPAPVHVAGERLLLDPEGALFWPRERVLALADLSFGRGSGPAGGETIRRLAGLLRRWRPRHVLVLETVPGTVPTWPGELPAGLPPGLSSRLAAMAASNSFVWIRDRADNAPSFEGDGGRTAEFWHSPPLVFRPRPAERAQGEVAGHLRPIAVPVDVSVGVSVGVVAGAPATARPCFVADGMRVLLPAFGPATSGTDVRQPPIQALFPYGARVFLTGAERRSSFPILGKPIIGRRARRQE